MVVAELLVAAVVEPPHTAAMETATSAGVMVLDGKPDPVMPTMDDPSTPEPGLVDPLSPTVVALIETGRAEVRKRRRR